MGNSPNEGGMVEVGAVQPWSPSMVELCSQQQGSGRMFWMPSAVRERREEERLKAWSIKEQGNYAMAAKVCSMVAHKKKEESYGRLSKHTRTHVHFKH